MSYTYLPEPGAESSAECYSDMPQFALWKLNPTAERSYSKGSETESCLDFQSGTTLKLSTGSLGADALTSCAVDSPAKIFPPPERGPESKASGAGYGQNLHESFVRWDRVTHSWKTRQCSLLAGLDVFSETWPKWGMMLDGECYLVPTPDTETFENGSGFLPTICASEIRDISRAEVLAKLDKGGRVARRLCSRQIPECLDIVGLNPCFAEWMQGWPDSWTELKPLETGKILTWLRSHSER